MTRKATLREIENRIVEKIVKRIVTIEKYYGSNLTRKACYRYYHRRGNELKLKREIAEKEKELESMKKKQK